MEKNKQKGGGGGTRGEKKHRVVGGMSSGIDLPRKEKVKQKGEEKGQLKKKGARHGIAKVSAVRLRTKDKEVHMRDRKTNRRMARKGALDRMESFHVINRENIKERGVK